MNTFNKISLFATAMIMATSCSDQFADVDTLSPDATAKMSVTAGAAQTRTSLEGEVGNFSVVWCDGDAISIWDEGGVSTPSEFIETSIEGATATSATFEGTMLLGEELYAFYPYSSSDTFEYSLKRISFELSSAQIYDASGSFASGASPAYGYSDAATSKFTFANICGVLRLSLSTSDSEPLAISKIVVSSSADNLAGSAKYSIDSQEIVIDRDKSVTLDCGSTTALAADGSPAIFSIVLPPTSQTLTVTIYGEGDMVLETLTTASAIESNMVTWFDDVTLTASSATEPPATENGSTMEISEITVDNYPIGTEWTVTGGATLTAQVGFAGLCAAINAAYEIEGEYIHITLTDITALPVSAFAYESNPTKIGGITSESIISIGNQGFRYCPYISSVELPNVETIGNYAFGCTATVPSSMLNEVFFPSLKSLGQNIFANHSDLKRISLPAITSFDNAALGSITGIEKLEIATNGSATVTSWGNENTFQNIEETKLYIGENHTTDTSANELIAGSNTFTFGSIVVGNSSDSSAPIWEGEEEEEEEDNEGQNNEEITLNATTYTYDGTIPTEDNWIVEGTGNGKISEIVLALKAAYTENEDRRINLTVNISTGIPAKSFQECDVIKSLTIGSTVTAYNTYAFNLCSNLESVTINSNANITGHTFRECASLSTITIAGTVTTINDNAFMDCTALESISFPDVTTITNLSFSGCSSLKSISLPKVASVGNNTFRSITALETVILGTEAASLSLGSTVFGSEVDVTLSGVSDATLNICSSVTGTNVSINGNQLTCTDSAAESGTITYTFGVINQ